MLQPDQKLNQRYTIRRVLSTGLLSNVYEAEDIAIQRRVVLKEVVTGSQRATAARIQREASLYARLRHPHILQLLDVIVVDGNVYLVFPLIEGATLAEILQRGPLPIGQALQIAQEIAEALAFVHAQKIVHRDLKPANILLDAGRVVLADFGIAKETAEEAGLALTRSGQTLGTPLYMAPEAMRNESVGPPADVYAFGVVMFELFAAKPPFSGRNFAELVANRLRTQPPPLTQVRPTVPVAVSELVERMLRADPAARPTAAQIEWSLKQIAATVPSPETDSAEERAPVPWMPAPLPVGDPQPLLDTSSRFPPVPAADSPPKPLAVPPPGVPAPPPIGGADPDLSRTVVVRDHELARTVNERPDVELRGFFHDEISRQEELKRSRDFYRTQLSEDYGSLMLQAKISFGLWVLFSFVGFVVFIVGVVLLYTGQWREGAATLVSESIVIFIQKLFRDREDEFRERAAKKNRHVELGNLWNLAAQSLEGLDPATRREKLSKLTDAIIDQVAR